MGDSNVRLQTKMPNREDHVGPDTLRPDQYALENSTHEVWVNRELIVGFVVEHDL